MASGAIDAEEGVTAGAHAVDVAGFEPPSNSAGKTSSVQGDDAKSDALSADSTILTDPGLARIVAAWPTLPEALKARLWELVDSSFPRSLRAV
jgi:hypothetical protein